MTTLKLRYFIPICLYCALIFWLSSMPDPPIPTNRLFSFPGRDKVAHLVLYGGLGALLSIGIRYSNDLPKPWIQWYVPVAFAILYGITDEIHQLYVPNRSFEVLDLVADGTGATLAQLGLFILWRKQKATP